MKEQGKKIMETGNTKDVEVDLDKVGDKVVGGALGSVPTHESRIVDLDNVEEKTDQIREYIPIESPKVEGDLRRKVSLGDFAYAK